MCKWKGGDEISVNTLPIANVSEPTGLALVDAAGGAPRLPNTWAPVEQLGGGGLRAAGAGLATKRLMDPWCFSL